MLEIEWAQFEHRNFYITLDLTTPHDEGEYKLVKDYVSTVCRLQDLFVSAQNVNVASLGQPVPGTFMLNRCIRFPL